MRARVFGGQQDGLGKQASRQDRTGQAGRMGTTNDGRRE
jgi:hypothetical protein